MDNASDYGSEDSRFESWQARKPDFQVSQTIEINLIDPLPTIQHAGFER